MRLLNGITWLSIMSSVWVVSVCGNAPPDSVTRQSINCLVRFLVTGLASQSTSVIVILSFTELFTGWQLP